MRKLFRTTAISLAFAVFIVLVHIANPGALAEYDNFGSKSTKAAAEIFSITAHNLQLSHNETKSKDKPLHLANATGLQFGQLYSYNPLGMINRSRTTIDDRERLRALLCSRFYGSKFRAGSLLI